MSPDPTMIRFDDVVAAVVAAASQLLGVAPFYTGQAIILRDVTGVITLVLRNSALYEKRASLAELLIRFRPYVDEQPVATLEDIIDDSLQGSSVGFPEWVRLNGGEEIEVRVVDRRIVGADWQRRPYPSSISIPVVAFWSIKGGVGRSTALSVAAAALARRGLNILAIDLDLEAPGIGDMLLNDADRPIYGALDFFIENGLGRADANLFNSMIAPSRLTTTGGLVSVLPATGTATDKLPQNMLAKLARSYIDKPNAGSFLDQTQDLLRRLASQKSFDAIFIDARAGLNESTAASILGLGATVLLFGMDTAQNFRDFRYVFSHVNRFIGEGFDDGWRERLQMVHAKASASEARRKRFRDRSYDLFAEWIYDEAGYENSDAFNFDIDDPTAPHYGWPIFYDGNFLDFDLVEHPELLDTRLADAAFGEFILRLGNELQLSGVDLPAGSGS